MGSKAILLLNCFLLFSDLLGIVTCNFNSTCEISTLTGQYDRILLSQNEAWFDGSTEGIIWINQFTFYKWSADKYSGIFSMWIYNLELNGFHQIKHEMGDSPLESLHRRHSLCKYPKGLLPIKELGHFVSKSGDVYEIKEGFISVRNFTIIPQWINPLAMYFHNGVKGRNQIWIYDATLPGYLSVGDGGNNNVKAYIQEETQVFWRQ